MGYRHNIAIIDKEKLEELRNKVYVREDKFDYKEEFKKYMEIEDNCDYSFDLGKLYFDNTKDVYTELYKEKEDLVQDADVEMFICSQDIFFTLANVYLQKAKKYFESLFETFKHDEDNYGLNKLTKEKKTKLFELLRDLEQKIYFLNNYKFKKDEKGIEIGWLYEWQAFNLAHIHKTIDFEKQVVICYAG